MQVAGSCANNTGNPLWINYSSAELKKNIRTQNYTESIEIFKKLSIKKFNFKNIPEKKDAVGTIIQKEVVRENKECMGCIANDLLLIPGLEDTIETDIQTGNYGVDYSKLLFHSWSAIQNLIKRVEMLEDVINKLESKKN